MTGSTVSPILWQAALDTLDFVKLASEDPLAGSMVTDWYSPAGKPNERYKVNVFILARSLRSDAIAVTVTRQARLGDGNWLETTITRQVETDLENRDPEPGASAQTRVDGDREPKITRRVPAPAPRAVNPKEDSKQSCHATTSGKAKRSGSGAGASGGSSRSPPSRGGRNTMSSKCFPTRPASSM